MAFAPDHSGEVRSGEIGGTTDEFGQASGASASMAFCEALRVAIVSALSFAFAISSRTRASKSAGNSPFKRRSNSRASAG